MRSGGRLLASTKLAPVLMLALLFGLQSGNAQPRFMQLTGEIASPAFEGWWPNDDGTFKLFYGYMNSNWEEEFNIDIGSDNYFSFTEEGGLDDLNVDAYDFANADQGQPTHFYPRRNAFLFTIDVFKK